MHRACAEAQDVEKGIARAELRVLLDRIAKGDSAPSEYSQELKALEAKIGLSPDESRAERVEALRVAAAAVVEDKDVTEEEVKRIVAIQNALGLEASSVREELKDVARYALMSQVRDGKFPALQTPGLLLEEHEVPHWVCTAELYEEKVIRRYYQGGYSGVSIPIFKGIRWNLGGYHGTPVVQTGMVATDSGRMALTDRRVIFVGAQRSFSLPYKKILALQGFTDAISVQKDGLTAKPVFFKVEDPEMVGSVLAAAIARSRGSGATQARRSRRKTEGAGARD
jgi:hypothetical protein